MKMAKQRTWVRLLLLLLGGALFLLVRWAWVPAEISNDDCRFTTNAAWLSVDWTSAPVGQAAVERLAREMSDRGIYTLYPFTTYLTADGSFQASYDHAADFLHALRRAGPEQEALAWVGIPLEKQGALGVEGTVDLADESIRQQIVDLAVELVDEVGFDGVHLDVETVRSGDEHYLALLEEVDRAIGDAKLSVAGSYLLPGWINRLPGLDRFKWDGAYLRSVADRVDQIAVMTYDSGLSVPALYRLWLREQVRAMERNLAESDVELLIGLSASRELTLSHRPAAENVRNGLAGVCAGVEEGRGVVDGVAVYAAWEMDGSDWDAWREWREEFDE